MTRVLALAVVALTAASCIGDVELPPDEPTLFPPETPTRRARQLLAGTKPKGAGVVDFLRGEVVPPDDEESWQLDVELSPGANVFGLMSVTRSGVFSYGRVFATIVLEPDFPASPTLAPVRSPTNEPLVDLAGTKPAATGLVLDDEEIVPLGAQTEWQYQLELLGDDGPRSFSLAAVDDKGRRSEPVDFTVVLDRAPPAVTTRFPDDGAAAVPTSSVVAIALDDVLELDVESLDPELFVVEAGGSRVTGSLSYSVLSRALVFRHGGLPADTAVTATLDPALVVDVAGNAASASAGGPWSFAFTTGASDDATPPAAPTVSPPSSPTTLESAALAGTKSAGASVLLSGVEIVAHSSATTWSFDAFLAPGENVLELFSRSGSDVEGPTTSVTVVRDLVKPSPPVVTSEVPASVDEAELYLEGTRESDTSVLLNGVVVVPRASDTTWSYHAPLVLGVNELELRARSRDGVVSDPVRVVVDFAQSYEGLVLPGYKLLVSFGLRDLGDVDPLRSQFITGANKYGVDAWIEGPLDDGEECVFDDARRERRDIEYVATVTHYKGQKQGHTNPFHDDDYRNPDYVAALVSAGVLTGINPDADRRDDATGQQGGDLVDGAGKLRVEQQHIDADIDGITGATRGPGTHVLEWLPLGRDLSRVDQGEYLLHVVINLDRDPSWVGRNDHETCWGDDEFASVGQHRVVRRISLGAAPFTLQLGQAAETAAPDAEEGADQLRYLTQEGITIRWVAP